MSSSKRKFQSCSAGPSTSIASNDDLNNLALFNERQESAMYSVLKDNGYAGLCRYMNEHRNAWKNIKINIAVTGKAGSGKSSFVNAFLQLENDPCRAKVGIVQTTAILMPYQNPTYDKFAVWDLPGVGSPEFPRETYLEKVKYQKFDVFIVIASDRLTEDDIWLVNEACKRGIKTYFVRTKVHQDLQNEKNDFPATFNEKRSLQQIRRDCTVYLKEFKQVQIFLIDNKQVNMYDFAMLRNTINTDNTISAKEVFARLFESVAKQHLNSKRDTLKADIWKMAALSGAAGAIPYGLGILLDIPLLKLKMSEYIQCFGLDDETLGEIAMIKNMNRKHLLKAVALRFVGITAVSLLSGYASQTAARSAISMLSTIPIVGTTISACMSFGITRFSLENFVDTLYTDALQLMEFVSGSGKENEKMTT